MQKGLNSPDWCIMPRFAVLYFSLQSLSILLPTISRLITSDCWFQIQATFIDCFKEEDYSPIGNNINSVRLMCAAYEVIVLSLAVLFLIAQLPSYFYGEARSTILNVIC